VRVCSSLAVAAFWTPLLWGQPGLTRYIPALAYGPNMWSIVRLTNSGTMARTVGVDVYREDGTHLPIGPTIEVAPGATADVRIEAPAKSFEACWARVTLPNDVAARGIVEVLEGNALEDFSREMHELSYRTEWATLTSAVQEKYLYFLNAGSEPTVLTFCATNQREPEACRKKGSAAARFRIGPNQALGVEVHKPRQKFFITESSMPEGALLVLFDGSAGNKRVFGSKSTIEFGPVQQ